MNREKNILLNFQKLMSYTQEIDAIYEQVMEMIGAHSIDTSDYMELVVAVTQLVERTLPLKEDDRNNVIVAVVMRLVEYLKNSDLWNIADVLSETTVRNLVRVARRIFRGEFDFGKSTTRVRKWFRTRCGCC